MQAASRARPDREKSIKNRPPTGANQEKYPGWNGAGERNRTPDRLITNQLLYLLSYASVRGGNGEVPFPEWRGNSRQTGMGLQSAG